MNKSKMIVALLVVLIVGIGLWVSFPRNFVCQG